MLAEDVLGRKGSIIEQISTLRISNIPIGKQFADLLNSQSTTADKQVNAINDHKISSIKCVRYSDNFSIIMLVLPMSLQLWRFYDPANYMAPVLLHQNQFHKGIDNDVLDIAIISDEPSIEYLILTKPKNNVYKLSLMCLSSHERDSHSVDLDVAARIEKEMTGSCTHFCHNSNYVLVAHKSGMVRIFSITTLEVVTEIQGLVDQRVVMDVGQRWLAVESVNTNNMWNKTQSRMNEWMTGKSATTGSNSSSRSAPSSDDIIDVSGNMVDNSEDLVRLAISSAYQVGKYSWNSMSPYLQQQQQQRRSIHGDNNSAVNADKSAGGCVHIVELVSHDGCSSLHDSTTEVKSVAKFIAHNSNLTCIKFSSSGLKLASSDVNGQVVHVHSLCKASSSLQSLVDTESATETQSQYVQLLYKIHRGLTLVSIVNLRFSADDSLLSVVSTNNTMHIFGLLSPNSAATTGYDSSSGSLAVATAVSAVTFGANEGKPPESTPTLVASTAAETSVNLPKATTAAVPIKKGKKGSSIKPPKPRGPELELKEESEPEFSESPGTGLAQIAGSVSVSMAMEPQDLSRDPVVPSQVNVSDLVNFQRQHRAAAGGNRSNGRLVNTNYTTTVQAYSNARTTIPERYVLSHSASNNNSNNSNNNNNNNNNSNNNNNAGAGSDADVDADADADDAVDGNGYFGDNYAFSFIHRDYASESASNQQPAAAEYVVLCVTSQGYVCRYTCRRPLLPSSALSSFGSCSSGGSNGAGHAVTIGGNGGGGAGTSPPVASSGSQHSNTNSSTNSTATSFGSAYNSPLDNPLALALRSGGVASSTVNTVYELRETNRWDLLSSTRTLKKGEPISLIAAKVRDHTGSVGAADSYNTGIKRISWLSSVTQHDHLFNRHQTDLAIGHTIELLPCWRRHNVSLSVANSSSCIGAGPKSVTAIVTGTVVPNKVAGISNTASIPVLSLPENALVTLRLDTLPRTRLYDQLEASQSKSGGGQLGKESSGRSRVTYNSSVATAINMTATSGLSTDIELNRSKEEFQQRQEQLKLQRLQEAMANNIEIFDMDEDDSEWLSCEPQTVSNTISSTNGKATSQSRSK